MKKIIISILLFILPVCVYAEVDYEINDYYIESHILENGDLKVKELFLLEGTFNGYERDIFYTNNNEDLDSDINFSNSKIYSADGIYDVSIKAKYVDDISFSTMNDTDFNELVSTISVPNGSIGKYVKTSISGGEQYRMYYPADNENVAFYITYTIDNAVVIHNDVAELYWNFIGNDYADDLENLNIKVYLPKNDSSDNFRIWAHGDLTGEINYLKENNLKVGAIATMDKVDAYDPVDLRITFDKNLITNSTDLEHSNVSALDKIIEVETERAEIANELRKELKTKYYFLIGATTIYYISILIIFIYVVKKYGLDKKSDFDYEYNREFIEDYNVEVVDYLINKKNISADAMSASIMNLIYKKNIKVDEIDNKKKNYKFTLLNEEKLNNTEKNLINFLFNVVGKTDETGIKTFTTIDLKKKASSSYEKFIKSYTNWKNCVINDGEKEGFYENVKPARVIGIIFLLISILLLIIKSHLNVESIYVSASFIVAMIFLIYTFLNTKKSSKGSLHYKKWMAFKRFLNDFGTFPEKELPEITLWERYLVYATVLGIASKVRKVMNVKIEERGIDENPTYTHIYIHNNISNSINRAVNDAVKTSYERQAASRAAAVSSSSSGSGFGGGFSSGGGFGGGGGGGRGF